jgi:DNA (cytosine-5)-methyltransferase 1
MKLLDLFCGAGGCAVGYYRAGFTEIVGVDLHPQPRYPYHFARADALEFLAGVKLGEFDLIHASPPCQAYTSLRALQPGKEYPNLMAATREALKATGIPWVVENVPGSPMGYYVTLCGTMFGLRTYRHRRFETSELLMQPPHPPHLVKTSTKKRRRDLDAGMFVSVTGDVGSHVGPLCMGIDWMTGRELSQAIPPAYTEWIGREMLDKI